MSHNLFDSYSHITIIYSPLFTSVLFSLLFLSSFHFTTYLLSSSLLLLSHHIIQVLSAAVLTTAPATHLTSLPCSLGPSPSWVSLALTLFLDSMLLVRTHVLLYVCVCVCVLVCVCLSVCEHTHTHTLHPCRYERIYIHTCTHTHGCSHITLLADNIQLFITRTIPHGQSLPPFLFFSHLHKYFYQVSCKISIIIRILQF